MAKQVTNIVPNGSFEDGFTGWQTDASWTLSVEDAFDGTFSAKLETVAGNFENLYTTNDAIGLDVEKWSLYKFSLARNIDLTSGFGVVGQINAGDSHAFGVQLLDTKDMGDTGGEWLEQDFYFNTGPYDKVWVRFFNNNSVIRAFFDKISITKVPMADNNWRYRRKVTIDHTRVEGSTPLEDFPVFVTITDLALTALCQSQGQDILFTDVNGSKLQFELASFSQVTGKIVAFVRIPQLPTDTNTTIYMYYGNATCPSQSNRNAAWHQFYEGVWHVEQAPTGASGEFIDSTENNNHGTSTGLSASDSVTGIAGQGLDFDGSAEQIAVADSGSIRPTAAMTVGFWLNPDTPQINSFSTPVAKGNKYYFERDNASLSTIGFTFSVGLNGGEENVAAWPKIIPGRMNFVVGTYTQSDGTIRLYINGDLAAERTVSGNHPIDIGGDQLIFGNRGGFTRNIAGVLDEIFIMSAHPGADWIKTAYNNGISPDTFALIGNEEQTYSIPKHYFYRVYTAGVLVATWTKEVISEPRFRSVINGGPGQLIVELARPFDDFGEDDDVRLNNKVNCYVVDKDAPNGSLLYSGYISGYQPIINGVTEKVEVTILGFVAELERNILRASPNLLASTTVEYLSYDPSNILKDVIDKYRAQGGQLRYDSTTILLTNTVVSYTFNTNTIKECFDKVVELCPVGWFFRIDPDGFVYLRPKNILADHSFVLGKHVERLSTFRRIEDLINRVLFTGAGSPALFRAYENTGSQGSFGMYERKVVDQRVSLSATASIIANRLIDTQKDPEIRSTFTIIDNNGPGPRGYDIETIKPGQTLRVKNLKTGVASTSLWDVAQWDVDVWDQTLATQAADIIQIMAVEYTPDTVVIEASSRLPQIAKRVEDVRRNLENSQTVENPAAPS